MRRESKPWTVFFSAALACLVLSASVAAPILCRPFYYAQIGPLGLSAYTGLPEEEIRRAFDETVDFCTGLRDEFSTGVLPWSESGRSHFADVRGLFLLDLAAAAVSALLLAAGVLLCARRGVRPYRFWNRGPGFWAAAGLGTVFSIVGLLAALDFNRAFAVFHALFFPGKDNWLFDWRTDAVILILPEAFFRNCALLIGGLLLAWCAALIVSDLWIGKRLRSGPGIS